MLELSAPEFGTSANHVEKCFALKASDGLRTPHLADGYPRVEGVKATAIELPQGEVYSHSLLARSRPRRIAIQHRSMLPVP